MSKMSRIQKAPAGTRVAGLPPLPAAFRETFQSGESWPGLLPRGVLVYRYGSTQVQATSSIQPWVNFSEECFRTSEEVIQSLCLLDFTGSDLGEFDPKTGGKLVSTPMGRGSKSPSGEKPQPWNVAAWRGEFEVTREFYAWVGLAGPMAFDIHTGKRYRGPGDSVPHVSRPGGGSQVLVNRVQMPHLRQVQVSQIPRVKYLV